MNKETAEHNLLVDYITGKTVPNVGIEELRQRLEKYLIEEKGYQKDDILVDADIEIDIDGDVYKSRLDLVVRVGNRELMVIKCAAGSLASREREVVSAARIYKDHPLPRAAASDSKTAIIYDVITGKKIGEGLDNIPSRDQAIGLLSEFRPVKLSDKKMKKEKIIFRSYDSMNVNVVR